MRDAPCFEDSTNYWLPQGSHSFAALSRSTRIPVGLLADIEAAFSTEPGQADVTSCRYLGTYKAARSRRRAWVATLRRSRRPRKQLLTADEWEELKTQHRDLADVLDRCRAEERCGSLACPVCRRVSTIRRRAMIGGFVASYARQPGVQLHQLTVVAHGLRAHEGSLHSLDPIALNGRLLEVLDAIPEHWVAAGNLEVSYEEVVGSWSYWQPHWHLLAAGADIPAIATRLRDVLPCFNPKNPSVVAPRVYDLTGAVRYSSKPNEKGYRSVAEANEQATRRAIPDTRRRELLLWLDRWAPWDFLVLQNVELTSSAGEVRLRSTMDIGGAPAS